MSARRCAALALTLSAGLTACASFDFLPTTFLGDGCRAEGRDRLRAVDWTNVRVVPIIIRQDRFEPMVIRISQNEPYIFRFTNRDDGDHVFRAPDFFESIAVDKVVVAGREIQEPCMAGIGVPPGAVIDMHFIPSRDGRYEFSDSRFGLPSVFDARTSGVVYITVPRERVESPVNLRVVEPPPPVPLEPPPANQPAPFGLPSGFPVDPSMQAPGVTSGPLPGDSPVRLPGDDSITLPGDASMTLPGDAPVALPGDAPLRLPGDAPTPAPRPSAPPASPANPVIEGLAQ